MDTERIIREDILSFWQDLCSGSLIFGIKAVMMQRPWEPLHSYSDCRDYYHHEEHEVCKDADSCHIPKELFYFSVCAKDRWILDNGRGLL